MRRILTSQYSIFSPNWICHSNSPSHTITSLSYTTAGPDTTSQSRYTWMVGISVRMLCVCVALSLFPLFFAWCQSKSFVLGFDLYLFNSVSNRCCSLFSTLSGVKSKLTVVTVEDWFYGLIESRAFFCCYGLLYTHYCAKYGLLYVQPTELCIRDIQVTAKI